MGAVHNLIQLKQSGLTEAQVEAIVNFVESNQEPLATRVALKEVHAELKADIAEVKINLAEVKAEVKAVKAELKNDIADIKIEMSAFKSEVRTEFARLEQHLTLRMGGFAVFIVGFISALKLFA